MGHKSTLLPLLIAVVFTSSASAWIPDRDTEVPRTWPCPSDPADIDPCVCSTENKQLTVSCTGVDAAKLDQVFSANFAFKVFSSFSVKDSKLGTLKTDVFHDMSFKTMVFENSGLEGVEAGAFAPSYNFLDSLSITETTAPENPYPWPLDDLDKFAKLKELTVSAPFEAPKVLASSSLKTVSLDIPGLTDLQAAHVKDLTAVTTLSLAAPVGTIGGNTFKDLANLETLSISKGALANVVKDAFAFDSANLVTLTLSNNGIKVLEEGAISVKNKDIVIDLKANLLSTVESTVFEPVLKVIESGKGTIDLKDNPLLCGCDLYWIVKLDEAQNGKLLGVTSSCGVDDIEPSDLIDFLDFQCGTSGTST